MRTTSGCPYHLRQLSPPSSFATLERATLPAHPSGARTAWRVLRRRRWPQPPSHRGSPRSLRRTAISPSNAPTQRAAISANPACRSATATPGFSFIIAGCLPARCEVQTRRPASTLQCCESVLCLLPPPPAARRGRCGGSCERRRATSSRGVNASTDPRTEASSGAEAELQLRPAASSRCPRVAASRPSGCALKHVTALAAPDAPPPSRCRCEFSIVE